MRDHAVLEKWAAYFNDRNNYAILLAIIPTTLIILLAVVVYILFLFLP